MHETDTAEESVAPEDIKLEPEWDTDAAAEESRAPEKIKDEPEADTADESVAAETEVIDLTADPTHKIKVKKEANTEAPKKKKAKKGVKTDPYL